MDTASTGSERRLARLAWPLLAVFITLAVVGTILQTINSTVGLDDYVVSLAFTLMCALGAFMVSQRPRNAVGWIFLLAPGTAATTFFLSEYGEYAVVAKGGTWPLASFAVWAGDSFWAVPLGLLATILLLVFPTGHLPSRRWRIVAWGSVVAIALVAVSFALTERSVELSSGREVPNPFFVDAVRTVLEPVAAAGLPLLGVFALLSAASLVVRYRRAGSEERHQLKWFLFAAALLPLMFAVGDFVPDVIGSVVFVVALVGLAASATVAIVKYRLDDIDVVINRALLYTALALFFTAIYVGLVVGVGALVGTRGNVVLSVVATAVIAVAFQPFRERASRLANRIVYGERATPYEVLSEFADRMGGTYSSEDVLPRMAAIVGEGTGAARAEVWLRVGGELRRAAAWPAGEEPGEERLVLHGDEPPAVPGMDRVYAVRDRGELLGALAVAKPPSAPLTAGEDRLVRDIASQAGLVLRNVRLIAELRASRQRIVAAQDQERRRIERNIHDGAQQQLVALAVKLRLARQLVPREPAKAESMLAALEGEAASALEELRDLARGIYPPLLADHGLVAAVEAQTRRATVPVTVEARDVGRYPPDVEAAVYFCVLEALQNVAKYAEASAAGVALSDGAGELRFEVRDDGRGFDPLARPAGSGLQGIADRMESLGGSVEVRSAPGEGTTIRGAVPAAVRVD